MFKGKKNIIFNQKYNFNVWMYFLLFYNYFVSIFITTLSQKKKQIFLNPDISLIIPGSFEVKVTQGAFMQKKPMLSLF